MNKRAQGFLASRGRRPRHGERGVTMVEFAIASTFFIIALFAVIDFGRALFTYETVAHVAELGARYAMVRGSQCTWTSCTTTASGVTTYVQSQAGGLTSASLSVTTTWAASNTCNTSPYNGSGCIVTVSTSYPFKFVTFPFSTVTMTGSSQMTISQ